MPDLDASIESRAELESQSDASEFPSNTFAGLHTLSPCTLAFIDESVEKRYVHHKRSHAQFKRGIWISRWCFIAAHEVLRYTLAEGPSAAQMVLGAAFVVAAAGLRVAEGLKLVDEVSLRYQIWVLGLCLLRTIDFGLASDMDSFVRGVDYAADTTLFVLVFGLATFPGILLVVLMRAVQLAACVHGHAYGDVAPAAGVMIIFACGLTLAARVQERGERVAFAHHLRYDALHSVDLRGLQNPFSAPNLAAWIHTYVRGPDDAAVGVNDGGRGSNEHKASFDANLSSRRVTTKSTLRRESAFFGPVSASREPSSPRLTKRFGVLERWELDHERLRIVAKIGAGSAGHVWRGEYLGATVAIKQLYSSFLDPTNLSEFSREVTLLHQLKHPHVLTFFGIARRDVYVYIVTEFCPYALDVILRAPARDSAADDGAQLRGGGAQAMPRLSVLHRLKIAREVALALDYLHTERVLHRDLKPGNILLNQDLSTRVSDFGVSQRGSSQSQTLVGTPAYAAPELIRQSIDEAALALDGGFEVMSKIDVYAFGVVLAAMFAPNGDPYHYWRREHPRKSTEALEKGLMRAVADDGLRPVVPAALPAELRPLMRACWAHEPLDRPRFAALKLALAGHLVSKNALAETTPTMLPIGPEAQEDEPRLPPHEVEPLAAHPTDLVEPRAVWLAPRPPLPPRAALTDDVHVRIVHRRPPGIPPGAGVPPGVA
ncbi:kinase-like domain-containing protein [Pelagophyceae sp. CCMP2097]|nr:kinase-like domain-containing protein [Pelagophyceae sp. CCMP2097]|mmetsp:Transcript_5877/g.20833  ORF Transcript_5877/g.20833 Transcript_5877/m.20833 type:complete len:715 (-) Transcript_5877:25-2169(-)